MRIEEIDRVRGLAVVAMVTEHTARTGAAVQWWPSGVAWWTWATVGRVAFPLFMACAGYLWWHKHRRRQDDGLPIMPDVPFKRIAVVCAAAALATPFTLVMGLPPLEVLWSYALALAAMPGVILAPGFFLIAGMVFAFTFPLPMFSYHPGYVLAVCAAGTVTSIDQLGRHLPAWLAMPGRWPLTIYVGHLAVLAGVTLCA